MAFNLLNDSWGIAKAALAKTASPGRRLLHRKPHDSTSSVLVDSPSMERQTSSPSVLVKSTGGKAMPEPEIISSFSLTRPPRMDWPVQSSAEEVQSKSPGWPSLPLISPDLQIRTHRKSISFNESPRSARSPTLSNRFSQGDDMDDGRSSSVDCERPTMDVEKRKSWWTHRKTSSDGGEPTPTEEHPITEAKNEQFKSLFAIPPTERLLQSMSYNG